MTEMPDGRLDRNKEVVRHLVDHMINQWRIDELDHVFTPDAAPRAREDFESFRSAFPDWQMELKELIAEGESVVARFKCLGTHKGGGGATDPPGRRWRSTRFLLPLRRSPHPRHVGDRRHLDEDAST